MCPIEFDREAVVGVVGGDLERIALHIGATRVPGLDEYIRGTTRRQRAWSLGPAIEGAGVSTRSSSDLQPDGASGVWTELPQEEKSALPANKDIKTEGRSRDPCPRRGSAAGVVSGEPRQKPGINTGLSLTS